jgi:HK97 family phage major capsid protein
MTFEDFNRELQTHTKGIHSELSRLSDEIERLNAVIRRGPVDSQPASGGGDVAAALKEAPQWSDLLQGKARRLIVPLSFDPLERKTTITSGTVGSSTPGILTPQRIPGLVTASDRVPRVRDLLPRASTTQSAVEFVKVNVFTNNASYQVEANAKPESALTFTIDYAPVRTIAHWIPATRQVLDDWPQLRGYIDNRLLYGLAYKEDVELLFGDGLGAHMTGLCTDAIPVAGTYALSGDTYIDKLAAALTELSDAEYQADGIILHPSDWHACLRVKTDEGGANKGPYILGTPRATGPRQLWDVPVVTTTAMQRGKYLVGAFQQAATYYVRQDATVELSTEHSDYFVKNMVAIRAELRAALVITVPEALRCGTF